MVNETTSIPRRGIIQQTGSILAFRGVTLVLQAATGVIAARVLGVTGRGIVAVAASGPQLVSLLLFLGMGVANVYFLARDEVKVGVALGTSAAAVAAVCAIATPAYIGVALLIRDSVLHGLPIAYIALGGFLIPLILWVRYVSAVAQGLRRIALLNSITLSQACATLLLYVVLLLALDKGPYTAFSAIVVATAAGLLPALVMLRREYGRWHVDKLYLSRAVRFGARGEASNLITFLGYRIDLLIVAAFLGFAGAGVYVVAFTVAELLWVVPNALALVLFPTIAATASDQNADPDITARLARLTALLLLAFGVIGSLVAPWTLPFIFSREFSGSAVPLQLLVPGVILFGVGKVLTADLAGRGRPGVSSLANALGLVLMVCLDLALIPAAGVPGAALASSVAYAFVFLYQARIFSKITGTKALSLVITRRSDLIHVRAAFLELVKRLRGRRLVGESRQHEQG